MVNTLSISNPAEVFSDRQRISQKIWTKVMLHTHKSHLKVSRLTRRIVLWVFFSVILIEALIFIPSYKLRKKELLMHMKDLSAARVAFLMQIVEPDVSNEALFNDIKQLYDGKVVVGGAFYTSDGKKIGTFGEMPELSIADVKPAGMTSPVLRWNCKETFA
jgi:adenylate cyclase